MAGSRRLGKTVILAAGDFPRKGGAARLTLDSARRVVCCDGAADAYRRRTGHEPDAVVGDCDSLRGRFANVVRVAEQDTNDLAKAAAYCAERGWLDPVVLGATGRREDHSIGNVFRALDLNLAVVTDHGRFVPVEGSATLRVQKGAAVSIFAPDPATRMTSKGLFWPLDGVRFENLYSATLNRASASTIRLASNRRVFVFVEELSARTRPGTCRRWTA